MRLASSVVTMTPSARQRRPSQSILTCFLLIAWSVCGVSAFVSSSGRRLHSQKQCRTIPILAQNSDDQGEPERTGVPQLPPCQDQRTRSDTMSSDSGDSVQPAPFGAPFVLRKKFELQYTCNVCETRNTNSVSRVACEYCKTMSYYCTSCVIDCEFLY
jgi:hypothetical protein